MTALEPLDLAGGAIVVTGGGSGVGEGLARAAAEAGMRVVVSDVAADRCEAVATAIRKGGGEALAVPADVSELAAVERLAAAAHEAFGDVRLLVNNAGIEATGYSWQMPPDDWRRVVEVNLLGVYHGVRAFVPRMVAAGGRAAVVNLSSIAALSSGPPQQSAYNASKHGVQGLSECLSLELLEVRAPISVHVVTPGPVNTRIFADAAATTAGAADRREFFHSFVSGHGMSGREAADIILDGVRRGDFWIATHPAMQDDAAQRRAGMLVGRTAPELVSTESLKDL